VVFWVGGLAGRGGAAPPAEGQEEQDEDG
jgi:hypothetical protein